MINFELKDFQTLYELFIELFGKKDFFYFDEIQNVEGWERFARQLFDQKKKVFVTGSNASMFSKKLGTHLTGRYVEINLYPFSFTEFLKFCKVKLKRQHLYLTEHKAELKKLFVRYMLEGGFPEYLKTKNKDYLRLLYDSILYRDIMARYGLTNERTLKELLYISASGIAKRITFNSVKKTLGLGSTTTVKEYFNYFEESYILSLLNKFDFSLKKQIYSPKKVYLIDTGLAINLGFRFSKDLGRLLENLVLIELKRRKKEVYYFIGNHECDFVLKEGLVVKEAIQVCYELTKDNKDREINALLEALEKFKLKKGLILTYDQEDSLVIGKKKIMVVPVWKWLLQ